MSNELDENQRVIITEIQNMAIVGMISRCPRKNKENGACFLAEGLLSHLIAPRASRLHHSMVCLHDLINTQ